MKSDSAGKTYQLHTVLEALFIEEGFEHKIIEQKVFAAWGQAVGDLIARNTQPVSLVKAKLTVRASSHAWVTELTLRRHHIIRKLNAEIGRAAVGDVRFQFQPSAPTREPKRFGRFQRYKPVEQDFCDTQVSPDVLEQIQHTLAECARPGVKDKFTAPFHQPKPAHNY